MANVSFQMLIDYLRGSLSQAEQEAVEAYLASNSTGQKELDRARQVLEGLQGKSFTPPSPSLLNRVHSAFRRKQARQTSRSQREATLQFDSWASAPPLGFRGVPQERQFLFHRDPYDIDLQIAREPNENLHLMRGQLLSEKPEIQQNLAGIELLLQIPDGDVARRGLTDELGHFTFSQLEQEAYTLHIILNDYDLIVDISHPDSDEFNT